MSFDFENEPSKRRVEATTSAMSGVRFGCGFGCGMALFSLACVAAFIAVGTYLVMNARSELQKQLKDLKPTATAPSTEPATEKAKIGDVVVEVLSVKVGEVPLMARNQRTASKDVFTKIVVRVTNHSQVKRIQATTWSYRDIFDPLIEATDEFGNKHRLVQFEPGLSVIGQQERVFNIDPGESVEDTLVFEKPIKAAKELRLTLPGKSVDQPQDFRLSVKIPR